VGSCSMWCTAASGSVVACGSRAVTGGGVVCGIRLVVVQSILDLVDNSRHFDRFV